MTRIVPLVILLLIACGAPSSSEAPQAAATAPPADTTSPTRTIVSSNPEAPTEPASADIPSTGTPAEAPAVDVTFGEPVNLSANGRVILAVPVTNDGETVKAFMVKATYTTGDEIVATAGGSVTDLLPGQTRAVLLTPDVTIPATFDRVRVDVETMISDRPSTSKSEAAQQIKFGPPKLKQVDAARILEVDVTNNDDSTHTLTVQGMIMKNDELVGVGTGTVLDIAAKQTQSLAFPIQGEGQGDITVLVDTMIQ